MKATEMLHILKTQNKRLFINGIVYDSFDCRDRFVEYCWIVK